MELSERKKKILRTVVEDYIETAEPVGSKAVAGEMDVSSATVRNEMAELESLGYLEQPHTSAGRVPSPQGYRLYVNELMERHRLSLAETEEINRSLKSRLNQLDKVLADAGQLASQLTDYPAYSMYAAADMTTIVRFDLIYVDANTFIIVVMLSNNTVKNKLVRLPACVQQETLVKLATVFNASFTNITEEKITASLIASTERALGDTLGLVAVTAGFAIETLTDVKKSQAFVSGASHLLLHPEYRDVGKAQRLMNYLSDGRELLKLAQEKGLMLGGAPDTFMGAGIQTCRRLIDDGFIGDVVGSAAFMICHGHETWHPDPDFYYQYGGGPMFDMGPYYLTALINLCGGIHSVMSASKKSFEKRMITSQPFAGTPIDVNVNTYVAGTIKYDSGAIGTLFTTFDVYYPYQARFEVYGSRGTLFVPDPNGFGGPVKLFRPEDGEVREVPLMYDYKENSRALGLDDMAVAIRTGREARADYKQTFHVLDLMCAFHDSANSGAEKKLQKGFVRQPALEMGYQY